jgi:Glycosyl transferase family 2
MRISTIIPTYNRAHLIERAIQSALRESRPGDEVIVVDNGSTDDTDDVVARYLPRIRYLRAERRGPGAARNVGLAHVCGDLVAFLDSDDEWMAGKLDLQRRLMAARPDVIFCFTDIANTGTDGSIKRHYLQRWHRDPRPWDEILAPAVALTGGTASVPVHIGDMYPPQLLAPYVVTSTVMVRRDLAGDALTFAEDLPVGEDLYCFARLARRGPAAYLDVETAWNNAHVGERATSVAQLVKMNCRLRLIERVWGADAEFLRTHGSVYRRVHSEQQALLVRALLAEGRTFEARHALESVEAAPVSYRMLAALPGALCRGAVAVRGALHAATVPFRPRNVEYEW